MRGYEHRTLGNAATGAATVNLGGDSSEDAFWLSFGEVVALSGDYFRPRGLSHADPEVGQDAPSKAAIGGMLFHLARIPGQVGTLPGTRDEIAAALKVMTVDEAVADPRFEPGGQFADFQFSPGANRSDVERTVRDRYLSLAAVNDDHFVAPGRSDVATGSGLPSARSAYHRLHQLALDEAWSQGRRGGDLSQAMAGEAAAQHYLTDAFAAGHLRTPVAAIRRYWKARYPEFWDQLQRRVASDTAKALRELSLAIRMVPARFVYDRTLAELTTRTSRYPELSLGDLVARCFHDWDNTHGLEVDQGGVIFGDGHIDEGVTTELALAAVRAGNDDVEVAFGLGASATSARGEALYAAVREATGASGGAFGPESKIPRVSSDNPPQNWHAKDVESLWESPMVGTRGTTVGEALVAMLAPAEQFIRQLDGLGQGLAGDHGVFAVPLLGAWLGQKCCQAYHDGFVAPLARDPKPVLLAVVDATGNAPTEPPSSSRGVS